MEQERKPLEELNLLDNFLFGQMVSHPEYGEEFSRQILQIILQRNFGCLRVIPQKLYYGSDTRMHGVVLDVYLEETEEDKATVYDVEPEKNNDSRAVKALPKRVRFYHSKIDGRSLKSGETYEKLKKVIIIMIMPFDPFGLDRMMYTIKSSCMEAPDMPYDDGSSTIFLYTKGTVGVPSEELRQLLAYMERSTEDNVLNDVLYRLHDMVQHVKHEEEVSISYMRIFEDDEEREARIRQKVTEELLSKGMEQGIRQGIQQGIQQGVEAMILDNLEEGVDKERILSKLVKRFQISEEKAEEYYARFAVSG